MRGRVRRVGSGAAKIFPVLVVVLPLVLEFLHEDDDEGEDDDEAVWLRPRAALCSLCPSWYLKS
jgi:hypothetical protein